MLNGPICKKSQYATLRSVLNTNLCIGFEVDFVGTCHDPDIGVHELLQGLGCVVAEKRQKKPVLLELVLDHLRVQTRTRTVVDFQQCLTQKQYQEVSSPTAALTATA